MEVNITINITIIITTTEVREEKEEGGVRVKRSAYEVTKDLAWLCCVYLDVRNIKVIACNQTEARGLKGFMSIIAVYSFIFSIRQFFHSY